MISLLKPRSVLGNRSTLEARRSNMKRRRALIALRPMGEGLEGRELMANLGLDPTFGFGGISNTPNPGSNSTSYINTSVDNVAVQSDGKILGVGSRSVQLNSAPFTSTSNIAVERLNADGTLDASYGSGGVFLIPSQQIGADTLNSSEVAIALQSDGKLLVLARASGTVGGNFVSDFQVIRLLQNGSLDTSFGTGGYSLVNFGTTATPDSSAQPTSIAIGPNGQIVVAGSVYNSTTFNQDFAVAQLTPGGALDTSFDADGKQTVAFDIGGNKGDRANAVVVQADGMVILVGAADVGTVSIPPDTFQNTDIAVARLTAQGALDTSFGAGGKTTIAYDLGYDKQDSGNAVVLLPNQIIIAGTSSVSDSDVTGTLTTATLTRLSLSAGISSKAPLNLVQQGLTFRTEGTTLNVLADGSVLLGGSASSLTTNTGGAFFTNYFAGGGINTAFGTGGTSIINGTSISGNVAVQPDGKLVFANYSGIARTTGPAPAVAGDGSAQLVFTSTKKNAKSNTITIKFNTALNPALAGNKSTYRVRIGKKGNRFAAIKRVAYDATSQTVTITLKQKFNRKAVLQVLVAPLGIAGADSQFLNGGQPTTIPVVATA